MAETIYKGRRLIVRRTRLCGPQATLWPNWRHFAFLTDLEGTALELDAFHRAHAVVELCIDDWKEGAGMEHCPRVTSRPTRRGCAVRARPRPDPLDAQLGGLVEDDTLVVAQTLRTRYFSVPARLVNRSGTPTLADPLIGPGPDRSPTPSPTCAPSPSLPPEQARRTGVAADEHQHADN